MTPPTGTNSKTTGPAKVWCASPGFAGSGRGSRLISRHYPRVTIGGFRHESSIPDRRFHLYHSMKDVGGAGVRWLCAQGQSPVRKAPPHPLIHRGSTRSSAGSALPPGWPAHSPTSGDRQAGSNPSSSTTPKPPPFRWTATAASILAVVDFAPVSLGRNSHARYP